MYTIYIQKEIYITLNICKAQMQMALYEDHELNTKISISSKSNNVKSDLL